MADFWLGLLEHMHKKFEINQTNIKGSCQSGRKVVTLDSKSDLPVTRDSRMITLGLEKLLMNMHLENL